MSSASKEKDTPPCNEMLCLGIWINTTNMSLSVPPFRVTELKQELQRWLNKTTYTKRALQKLLGKLSYVTACVRPGRAFIARLLNTFKHCGSRCGKYPVTTEIRLDIEWWIYFLSYFNGISVIPANVTISNPELFATNACSEGCGGVCFGEVFSSPISTLYSGRQPSHQCFRTANCNRSDQAVGTEGYWP